MSKKGGDKGGKEKEVANLYKELAALRPSSDFEPSADDYEKAIKVCNKLLNLDQSDSTAFHCKIVAMVQAGKFNDCLKQLENSKHDLDLQFEAAYCHYRLNDPHKAIAILDKVTNPLVKHRELKAQVLYRLEQFEDCFSVYREIIRSSDDKYEVERKTNLSAVTAQLGDQARMLVDETDTFEQRYNAGCNYAMVGEYEKAEKVLVQAEKAARNFLEEDEAGEDEILEETGIIRVQLGFVMQKQGRDKEAQTIYNQVLKNKPSDIGLVAVASNNLLTINRDQNIFDSKKRIKAATVEGLELKLTCKQRAAIARNNALLAMVTAQVELCRQLVSSLSTPLPDQELIIAGVLSKAGKHSEAVDTLLGGGQTDPALTLLICGHILLTAGQLDQAAATLAKLAPEWKYRVGVLSTLVCLHLAMDNRKAAAELLKAAVEWNKQSGTAQSSGVAMATVWRKTAEFHLKSGEARVAAQSLEELQKLEPGLSTLAQLVLAYARFDLSQALAVSKKLPPFSAGSVDVDTLESGSWAMGAKQFKKTPRPGGEKTPKIGTDETLLVNKKKKQKKKKRLPKNYNPNADPDPERWLPKRERTGLKYMPGYRKPRKDKRKAEKFTGAQGTDQGKAETYDYSNKIAGVKDAANKQASPVAEPAPGPRQQQKGPGRTQNKKKKGGKNKF